MNELPPDEPLHTFDHSLLYEIFEQANDPAFLWSQAINNTRMSMAISDPNLPGNPLVYVNRAFCELTGYERDEVVGRNCRFLQGPETGVQKVAELRSLLERREAGVVEILNYRKDGSQFWNALHVSPIYSRAGKLAYFFGSQWNVDREIASRSAKEQFEMIARELNHRLMNIFAVVSALITMSAEGDLTAKQAAAKTRERINALANVHRATLDWSARNEAMGLLELLKLILEPYNGAETSFELVGRDTYLPVEVVTPLGLILHEMATNSLRYGYLSGAAGAGKIAWKQVVDFDDGRVDLQLEWRETFRDKPGDEELKIGPGRRIKQAMLVQLDGKLERTVQENDLVISLQIPLVGRDAAHEIT